ADGQQRVGDLRRARIHERADRLVLRLRLGPERLEPRHEVVEHVVDGFVDEARLDRLDDGEGPLDRQPREAALRIDLLVYELHTARNHLRAVARYQQDLIQRRHGGKSNTTPGAARVIRMGVMGRPTVQPKPRTALAILTGLNFLNYLDRFIPAAILPTILRDF